MIATQRLNSLPRKSNQPFTRNEPWTWWTGPSLAPRRQRGAAANRTNFARAPEDHRTDGWRLPPCHPLAQDSGGPSSSTSSGTDEEFRDVHQPVQGQSPGAEAGTERPGGSRGEPLMWQPPTQGETFIILKADVTKAHRRIKVLQKDWKYQVACIQNRWWVNRVGTYGMASAQLYWGRKASLVLRLLYYIFPGGLALSLCGRLRVLRCSRADWDATAILATLLALGVPLS